jgi:putative ABC transport system substrate-binding protein
MRSAPKAYRVANLVHYLTRNIAAPAYPYQFRRVAEYVDRILKGAKPADLAVQNPTQFKLVVNLKAAKTIGLTIQETLLVRADEVID